MPLWLQGFLGGDTLWQWSLGQLTGKSRPLRLLTVLRALRREVNPPENSRSALHPAPPPHVGGGSVFFGAHNPGFRVIFAPLHLSFLALLLAVLAINNMRNPW